MVFRLECELFKKGVYSGKSSSKKKSEKPEKSNARHTGILPFPPFPKPQKRKEPLSSLCCSIPLVALLQPWNAEKEKDFCDFLLGVL
jgi:hypothetical protein